MKFIVINIFFISLVAAQSNDLQLTSLISENLYEIQGSESLESAKSNCLNQAISRLSNSQPMLPPGSLSTSCIMDNKEAMNVLEELVTDNNVFIKIEVVVSTEFLFSNCVSLNNSKIN